MECSKNFTVHPQNVQLHKVQLQNVQLPNVQLRNVQLQNVPPTKRPGIQTSILQNVRVTKRPLYKTSRHVRIGQGQVRLGRDIPDLSQ